MWRDKIFYIILISLVVSPPHRHLYTVDPVELGLRTSGFSSRECWGRILYSQLISSNVKRQDILLFLISLVVSSPHRQLYTVDPVELGLRTSGFSSRGCWGRILYSQLISNNVKRQDILLFLISLVVSSLHRHLYTVDTVELGLRTPGFPSGEC
jgi:hypothetical protein